MSQEKLITVELGKERWRTMRGPDHIPANGHWLVDVTKRHCKVNRHSKANQEWNWRTLLLMQRSGMVRLRFRPPVPPQTTGQIGMVHGSEQAYFDSYFNKVDVEVVAGGDLDQDVWRRIIGQRRAWEHQARDEGFFALSRWLRHPSKSLCGTLAAFYSRDGAPQPALACGGCPACRAEGRGAFTPTLGLRPWFGKECVPTEDTAKPQMRIRFEPKAMAMSSLIREWKPWIQTLLQSGRIQAIRARREVLDRLAELLPTGATPFWCSLDGADEDSHWPELVLVTPDADDPTPVLWPEQRQQERILVAPSNLIHPLYPYRKWWEGNAATLDLEDFRRRL